MGIIRDVARRRILEATDSSALARIVDAYPMPSESVGLPPVSDQLYHGYEEVDVAPQELYTRLDVKRGLRNSDGTGVLVGLTGVSNVHGYKKENGVVVPKTVSIVGLQVMSSSTKTLTLPNACTVGDYFVTVTAIDAKLVGNFKSVSTVVVGANVVIIGARSFAKAPKVKKLVVKSARLKRVTNCLAGSKVKRVTTKVWLSKKDRKKYKKWFTKKAGKKGVKFVYA